MGFPTVCLFSPQNPQNPHTFPSGTPQNGQNPSIYRVFLINFASFSSKIRRFYPKFRRFYPKFSEKTYILEYIPHIVTMWSIII